MKTADTVPDLLRQTKSVIADAKKASIVAGCDMLVGPLFAESLAEIDVCLAENAEFCSMYTATACLRALAMVRMLNGFHVVSDEICDRADAVFIAWRRAVGAAALVGVA